MCFSILVSYLQRSSSLIVLENGNLLDMILISIIDTMRMNTFFRYIPSYGAYSGKIVSRGRLGTLYLTKERCSVRSERPIRMTMIEQVLIQSSYLRTYPW